MTHSDLTSLRRPTLLAIAGVGLLSTGFAIGRMTATEPVAPPASAAQLAVPEAAPVPGESEITTQLTALQLQVQRLHSELLSKDSSADGASTDEIAPATGRIAIDPAPSGREVTQRLQRIEAMQRQILSLQSSSMAIPPGVGVTEFFMALKEGDSDRVTAAHHLWTFTDVQAAYGPPDEVLEREDYIEWVYRLPDEDQFDFHFVNGLCVVAH